MSIDRCDQCSAARTGYGRNLQGIATLTPADPSRPGSPQEVWMAVLVHNCDPGWRHSPPSEPARRSL